MNHSILFLLCAAWWIVYFLTKKPPKSILSLLLLIACLLFTCSTVFSQKYVCGSYNVVNKGFTKTVIAQKTVDIDTIKHQIKIPFLKIYFFYKTADNQPGGIIFYINEDYGQLIFIDKGKYAKFEYFSGSETYYEFNDLRILK